MQGGATTCIWRVMLSKPHSIVPARLSLTAPAKVQATGLTFDFKNLLRRIQL